MALPLRDQRHRYLRYEGLQYTDADIVDFETRLARIYRREIHRVWVFDFKGLPDLMAEGLSARMLMKHKDAQGYGLSLMTLVHGYPQDLLGRRGMQAVPPPPRTQDERIAKLEEEVHGMREALLGQRAVLDSIARDFSRFSTWTVTSLTRMMDRAGVPYTRYSKSPLEYERCTRCRTDGANTSTAPQQPDP
nr:hypothetical protein [Tanacetum cinerariifolium]